jgi:uncharacterized protein (DUF58 family)
MIPTDKLRQIRRIELRTRKLVNSTFAGSYHAVFKGQGITFDAVRAYEPGDDVRAIDWNVTARTGDPFIKQFVEDRELTVMLAVDASASVLFGTVRRTKHDLAAELGAVLALSAIANNDKAGLVIFSDRIERYVPPRKGRNHVLHLINDLLAVEPSGQGTDMVLGLKTLDRTLKRRSIIFLLSDFLVANEAYLRELLIISRKHDVIAITLSDRLERNWPDVGMIGLQDAETSEPLWVDTRAGQWLRQFRTQARRFQQIRDTALDHAQVDRIDLDTDGDYVQALLRFFRQRELRRRA